MQKNVECLKGEASAEEMKMATQYKGKLMPLPKQKFELEEDQVVDKKLAKVNVFSVIRQSRMPERKWGHQSKVREPSRLLLKPM